MRPPLLSVQGLRAAYGRIQALQGVDLEVWPGEVVAVIGPNGAGKTTLLRVVAGLMAPLAGKVLLDGRAVAGRPAEEMVRLGVALVPEGRQVFYALSVWDNLLLGAYHRRRGADLRRDLQEVFQLFPALAERRRQPAGTLSGGEQQMLAIGRALMARPRLLMLDEPSLGLAPKVVRDVMARLAELRQRGVTILVAEQHARAALAVADRAYVLERGRIVLSGSRERLQEEPAVKAAYLGRRALGAPGARQEAAGPGAPLGRSDE
jgi:branched-chain amino acid transport system ATP-binding protein